MNSGDPIRVVIVDDSPTMRNLLVALLESAGGIQVVGAATNGEEATRIVARSRPKVVLMDINMPRMDGLEATRWIMREAPTAIVILSGDASRSETDLTFEALKAGALTLVRKPAMVDGEGGKTIVQTVRLMSEVPVVRRWGKGGKRPPQVIVEPVPHVLEPEADGRKSLEIVGIAASTGGPEALAMVLRNLPRAFPLPILIVQHMTPGFLTGLAQWLGTQTLLPVKLASQGERVKGGTVLIAPDDYHLQIDSRGIINLSKEASYKGLRPSANYLFKSLAQAYGSRAIGVVLTGMGDDGAEGLRALRLRGGLTIAQDEQSSVVYGMPREAVLHEAADRILSLDSIGLALNDLTQRQE